MDVLENLPQVGYVERGESKAGQLRRSLSATANVRTANAMVRALSAHFG